MTTPTPTPLQTDGPLSPQNISVSLLGPMTVLLCFVAVFIGKASIQDVLPVLTAVGLAGTVSAGAVGVSHAVNSPRVQTAVLQSQLQEAKSGANGKATGQTTQATADTSTTN